MSPKRRKKNKKKRKEEKKTSWLSLFSFSFSAPPSLLPSSTLWIDSLLWTIFPHCAHHLLKNQISNDRLMKSSLSFLFSFFFFFFFFFFSFSLLSLWTLAATHVDDQWWFYVNYPLSLRRWKEISGRCELNFPFRFLQSPKRIPHL